jgi:hypothetical protein
MEPATFYLLLMLSPAKSGRGGYCGVDHTAALLLTMMIQGFQETKNSRLASGLRSRFGLSTHKYLDNVLATPRNFTVIRGLKFTVSSTTSKINTYKRTSVLHSDSMEGSVLYSSFSVARILQISFVLRRGRQFSSHVSFGSDALQQLLQRKRNLAG